LNVKKKNSVFFVSFLVVLVLVFAGYIYRSYALSIRGEFEMEMLELENPYYFGAEGRNGLLLSLRLSAELEKRTFSLESSEMKVVGYLSHIDYEGIMANQSTPSHYYKKDEWVILVFYVGDEIVRKEVWDHFNFALGKSSIIGNTVVLEFHDVGSGDYTHDVEFSLIKVADVDTDCKLNSLYDPDTLDTDYTVCFILNAA